MTAAGYFRQKFNFSESRTFEVPSEPFGVTTSDGVAIAGSSLSGTGELSFLVVHGFTSNHRGPGMLEFTQSLTRFGPVWGIDLRGHGLSGGVCTLGNRETLDVEAATQYVRGATDLPIVVVGFSLGAAAAVASAANHQPVEAVVSIGGPSTWDGPRGPRARQASWVWRIPGGLTALRLTTGVRLKPSWWKAPPPGDVVGGISPGALLVVHGTDDGFFPVQEAKWLFEAAGEPKGLWLVEGGEHADGIFTQRDTRQDQRRIDRFTQELVSRVSKLLAGRS